MAFNKKLCERENSLIKICDIPSCLKRGKDSEEEDICAEMFKKKPGVCEDLTCPVVEDNKLANVGLNMEALEGILNNLTGLCKQPKCQAKYDDEFPCKPKTCPAKDPLKKQQRDFPGFSPAYAKIAKELQELKDLASQGLCRSAACYNAYMGYYPSTYQPDCGSATCCAYATGKDCGGLYCPFRKDFKKPVPESSPDNTCGNKPCPIAETHEPLTSICGRDSCPFLPKTICGNDSCPFVIETSNDSCDDSECLRPDDSFSSTCGGPKCPFARPNTPIGKNTCPYGGVPVCPYGGTKRTHKYAADKGFVNEAARPYCGSASPYDYLGSLEKNYANTSAQNYSLFNYTTPPGLPPCPHLNKKNDKDCGKPTCISRGAKMPDDFCVMQTCPWKNEPDYSYSDKGTGICGGPKSLSCNNADVDYCKSARCPVDKDTRQPKPSDDIGICGGPKNYSCDQSDVEYCRSPICEVEKPKESCKETTCPYMKKLVFCDDCGGALPDKDITITEFENGKVESVEDDISEYSLESPKIPETKLESKIDIKHPVAKVENEVVKAKPKADADFKSSIMSKFSHCEDISIYSYPGIQVGHKHCNPMRPMIPKNMGWLWNSLPSWGKISRWRGYKPGAVSRDVFEIIQKHRRDLGLADDDGLKKKRSKLKFKMEDLKHCVEVKKRKGDYTITVNPVKDPVKTEPFENPFIDCSPILFKVEKDKTEKEKNICPCDDEEEDKESSESEFEFMFSPPAAVPDTKVRKRKVYNTCNTQYDPKDIPSAGKKGKGKKDKKKGKNKKKGKKIKITKILITI